MGEPPEENEILLGGPVSRLSVSIRVAGDLLDPSEISRLFGVSPKFAARKGEIIRRGSRAMPHRVGIWTYGLTEEPSPEWELDDAIGALIARLPADLAVWQELGERFKLDIFCGLFMGTDNQGAVIAPYTLKLLAERGLTLDLDIYGPPSDDAAT